MLLSTLWGSVPNGKWLANHGFHTDGMCPHGCGAEDDIVHRISGCNEERMGKRQASALLTDFSEGTRALQAPLARVTLPLHQST